MDLKILLNRLHGGKNIKIPYFIGQVARYAAPRWWLRRRLDRVIERDLARYDRDYVLDRVNYYCRLCDGAAPAPDAVPIGTNTYRGKASAYVFDTAEYTRWFDPKLLWSRVFTDIVEEKTRRPAYPTLLKSRPIENASPNSVLLNMDKARLDVYLDDRTPFAEKATRTIFRGSVKSSDRRRRFIETFADNPRVDTADTFSGHSAEEKGTTPQITLYEHLGHKYIMTFEGNDISSNIRWVMSTRSIAVMPRPTTESWFMEGRLVAGYHYIEVKEDYSDLEEQMDWYAAHPDKAQEIIDHANAWARQFRDRRRERLIALLVLRKFFEKTGQLPASGLF